MEEKIETVTLEIGDRPYTLKAGDDPAYVRQVAQYVDRKMKEIAKLAPSLQPTELAVLTSVNIADELFQQGGMDPEALAEVGARIQALIDIIPS